MRVTALRCVSVLLASIANVGAANTDGELFEAIRAGNQQAVQVLLQQGGIDVNAPAADGSSPLHWAVRADDAEMTELLLRAKADASAANRYGITPLLLAATNGNDAIITRLLTANADPNAATPEGETALMRAARTGRLPAAAALLRGGADVNAKEGWLGETALMWAAADNHSEMTRLLIEHGADPNARSTELKFPEVEFDAALMWRAALPRGGLTPLMLAARQGALASARALADAGADVNLTDPDGTTALVIAVINAHYDLAALLLDEGADPNLKDAAGMAALYAAVDMHNQEPRFNRPLPLPSGRQTSMDIVRRLLDARADPNAQLTSPLLMRQQDAGDRSLGSGATPVMRAAKPSDTALVRLLLGRGADPALSSNNGTTLLMVAAARNAPNVRSEEDTIEIIELCLNRGVPINAATDTGETALHMAVGKGDAVVRFLAERGATLDARDKFGRTPLDVALGVPTKGRGGGPAAPGRVYESTAALLRELMSVEAGAAPK